MTTITATNLCDAAGVKIAAATAYFTPCKPDGSPLPGFKVGGGGQAAGTTKAVSAAVTNGVLASVSLHDSTLTSPANVAYRFSVKDAGGHTLIGDYVIQPSGATFSLDNYIPILVPLPLIQIGPQGESAYEVALASGFSGTQAQWIASLKGDPGDVSKPLLGAGVGYGLSNQLPALRNLFNFATITGSNATVAANGMLSPTTANYFVSDYIYVGGLAQFISNSMMASQNAYACCFYSIDKTFLSALAGPVAANTPINVPAGAAFFRFYSAVAADGVNTAPVKASAIMLVAGNTLPSSYTSFGYYANETVDGKIAKSGTDTKNVMQGYFQRYPNLLDLDRVQVNAAIHYANVNAVPAVTTGNNGFNLYGPIPVIAGGTVTANKPLHAMAGYGPAFMDVDGNFLPMGADLKAFWQAQVGIPANTPLNVPANAAYFWPYFNLSSSGTGDVGKIDNINTAMVVQGATFPSSYRPFVGQGFDLVARSAAQPLSGVKVGWLGDSISYGQGSNLKLSTLVAAITGMTDTYSLSWPGRKMYNALDNTGNTVVTAPTQAIFQSLDMVVIWLGTNLSGTSTGNIGTASDPVSVGTANANGVTFPSADTYCSQLKGVIEQILAWNPNIRIVKASPYQCNNQNAETGSPEGVGNLPSPAGLALLKQVHDMDVAVAGLQYGIPVLDLYSEMGICNANNATLTVDGTHPTAWFQQNRIAPYFARKLTGYALK